MSDKPLNIQGSGAFAYCKWCNGRGCLCCPAEYEKYMVQQAKPIFTAHVDKPEEMEALKRIVNADALKADYDEGGLEAISRNVNRRALIETIKLLASKRSDDDDNSPQEPADDQQ